MSSVMNEFNIKLVRFVIAVQDLKASESFYKNVLGFKISDLAPDEPGWRVFNLGECRILAGECPDDLPAAEIGSHSYFAYLVVDDIDTYFEHVTQQGGDVLKPLTAEPWGMREFAVRTIDGHRIMFGAPIE